jgi:hypothetical protein
LSAPTSAQAAGAAVVGAAVVGAAVVGAAVVGAAVVGAGLVWVGVEGVLQLVRTQSRATAAPAVAADRRTRRSCISVFS